MSTLRNIFAKSTVQAAVALAVIGTASYLAIIDRIDGPTYFGLALLVAGFYFGKQESKQA